MIPDTEIFRGDISRALHDRVSTVGRVAWDIETSGLDWSSDNIGTCQIGYGEGVAVVVMNPNEPPANLRALLKDRSVCKVFHHAPFDLRFVSHQWDVLPVNIECTKVASKILDPHLPGDQHSLKPVLSRHLNVVISKDQQVSDWLAPSLTTGQVEYAAADVRHLLKLSEVLKAKCVRAGLELQLSESYRYLPVRVSLDLLGSGDVFAY